MKRALLVGTELCIWMYNRIRFRHFKPKATHLCYENAGRGTFEIDTS